MAAMHLGFIGLGRMGGPMAGRLMEAGYSLTVFDTNEAAVRPLADRGAAVASSPAEVASQAPTVLMCLPLPSVVQAVVNAKTIRCFVDLSTTGPAVAAAVAKGLAERGVTLVDAPVSGGVRGARSGTLAVMVSCPKDTLDIVEPILKVFGRTFYTGEKPGLAQVVKLANNLLAATALVVSSEALAMGVKAGVDPKVMVEIINASSGRNSATEDKFPRAILPRTFDFGFATALSYKDVRLCVDEAESMGVPMVIGAAVRQMLAVTQAKFGPDSDFTSIAKVIEEWAGVEIKG